MDGFINVEHELPKQGQRVEVITCWDKTPHEVIYQGRVSKIWFDKGRYEGFGAYGKNIVTHWRLS
jgi:hypothetical protein